MEYNIIISATPIPLSNCEVALCDRTHNWIASVLILYCLFCSYAVETHCGCDIVTR